MTYPNARDCHHGRQRGHCPECELEHVEAQYAKCQRLYEKQACKLGEARKEVERLRREVRRGQVNCQRVARIRRIELPEGGSDEFRKGIAHAAWLVSKAMEEL